MFSRIIVATDLSPASFAVVKCLSGLRSYGASHCLLLQCLSLQEVGSAALAYTTSALEGTLAEQKAILEKQGFEVEARVVPGFARQEVSRIAKDEHYSLVIVGSQGHSLVGQAVLGGVAYGLIQGARTPVLVVPIEKRGDNGEVCLQTARCDFREHVLFPTDFSENADHAFTYITKVAADGAQRITLLHVQDKAHIDAHLKHRLEEFNEIDRARLEKMKESIQKRSQAQVQIEIRYGSPFAEITSVIAEQDIRLVIMGSQGRGFVEELFLGSVSHNVARKSRAPVLLIPARRR